MALFPISEADATDRLKNICLLATDMDGTLTQQGRFVPQLLQALETLAKADITVLIVTGRSAGWVDAIRSYLPIAGAIAENGGVYYSFGVEMPQLLTPIEDLDRHRQELADCFDFLKTKFPHLREAADNRFRLTDWTFDVGGLNLQDLQQLADLCKAKNWGFTYSTVQCHIKPLPQDKAPSLERVLRQYFPQLTRDRVLTIGDSPNDESLFDARLFPLSVGVANVLHYRDRLKYRPTYVTAASESEGFCELADLILEATDPNLNPISAI